MTDIPEGSITPSKLRADAVQIKLDEPLSAVDAKPTEKTNKLRVFKMNSRPQFILLWLILIITVLNMCVFSSSILNTGANDILQ